MVGRTGRVLVSVVVALGFPSTGWGAIIWTTDYGNTRADAFEVPDNAFTFPVPENVFGNLPTATLLGAYDQSGDLDWFSFDGREGEQVYFDGDGGTIVLGLSLFDGSGTLLAVSSSARDPGSWNPDPLLGVYTFDGAGLYSLAVAPDGVFPTALDYPGGPKEPLPTVGEFHGGVGIPAAPVGWDWFSGVSMWNQASYTVHFSRDFGPPAPIPEPATLALLGVGLAGVAVARRRRSPGATE